MEATDADVRDLGQQLAEAAWDGDDARVTTLLDSGANCDARHDLGDPNGAGRSAVYWAARGGHLSTFRLLKSAGANVLAPHVIKVCARVRACVYTRVRACVRACVRVVRVLACVRVHLSKPAAETYTLTPRPDNKQKAMYATPTFEPDLSVSPAYDVVNDITWGVRPCPCLCCDPPPSPPVPPTLPSPYRLLHPATASDRKPLPGVGGV